MSQGNERPTGQQGPMKGHLQKHQGREAGVAPTSVTQVRQGEKTAHLSQGQPAHKHAGKKKTIVLKREIVKKLV